jgi:hypothetical protein
MASPIWWKLYTDELEGFNVWELFRHQYVIRFPVTILLRAEVYWRLGDN